jgi:hypothetical protein
MIRGQTWVGVSPATWSTLQVLQEQLETAELALQDSQQLRMEYDRMCQQAYELSRKLSQAESAKGELQRKLADARCGQALLLCLARPSMSDWLEFGICVGHMVLTS